MSGRAMLCAWQVREVSESGRRSYEAYIMAPGVSKDNIKWGSSLHPASATPCLCLQHGPAGTITPSPNAALPRESAPRSAAGRPAITTMPCQTAGLCGDLLLGQLRLISGVMVAG